MTPSDIPPQTTEELDASSPEKMPKLNLPPKPVLASTVPPPLVPVETAPLPSVEEVIPLLEETPQSALPIEPIEPSKKKGCKKGFSIGFVLAIILFLASLAAFALQVRTFLF